MGALERNRTGMADESPVRSCSVQKQERRAKEPSLRRWHLSKDWTEERK